MTDHNLIALGIALGLGLLVGLQRERFHSRIAGIRTFTLITLMGSISAMLSEYFNQGWITAAGGLSIAFLFGERYIIPSIMVALTAAVILIFSKKLSGSGMGSTLTSMPKLLTMSVFSNKPLILLAIDFTSGATFVFFVMPISPISEKK